MIDTLFHFRERAAASPVLGRLGLEPRGYAVLTLHRPSNVDHPAALARALAATAAVGDGCPVVFPVHPRTRERLGEMGDEAGAMRALRLVEPLPYLHFVQLMASAVCVLTDSGGIQEETTALGVPCLTLRTSTERPITVTQGTNRLVGVDAARVRAAWAEIRSGTWPTGRLPELWDGKAAERIVRVLREHPPR
jgi:UDP-N-acetylglucosamine 2-epimerase (non-hydrolysing)